MMEANWDRGEREPELGLDAISALLGRRVVAARRASEGRASSVYLLESEQGERWALRFHRSPDLGNLEAAITAVLPRLMAPAILDRDPSGAWSLLSVCPGRTVESLATIGELDEISAAAPSIGRALAEISSVRFEHAGFLNDRLEVDPWPSTYRGLIDYGLLSLASPVTEGRLSESMRDRIRRQFEDSEQWLPALLGPPCLVHGDFKAGNLMVLEGRLSGVLDWEFAHSGSWLFSVAQVLRFEHQLPSSFVSGFVEGLREAGMELPEGWRRAALVLDYTSFLDFLAGPGSSDTVIQGVRELLERSLDRVDGSF